MATKENRLVKRNEPAPDGMTEGAKAHWKDVLGRLADDGVVRYIDLPIIAMACDFYDVYCKAKQNNDIGVMQSAMKTYVSIMEKFGATEKARQTMGLQEGSAKRKSKKTGPEDGGDFEF